DPIGLAGGINIHAYVPNPIAWVDPKGLCSTKLNKNLGGVTRDRMQAHHLIPEEIWGKHQKFFDRIGLEGQRDAATNGLLMPDSAEKAKEMHRKFYHCGSHPAFSAAMNTQVTKIEDKLNSGKIDAAQARNEIAALQKATRATLSASGSNPIRLF
ncbi:AHH domain-containing protein, partial [Chromobacterium violaceum]|uniref:AHH domain-containing protein n=1 Tax=Chromobacterium violaceum TaxID=536 RepID=UPI001CE0AB0A